MGERIQAELPDGLILFVKWAITQNVLSEALPPRKKPAVAYDSSCGMNSMDAVMKKVMDPIQLGLGDLKGPPDVKQKVVLGASCEFNVSLLSQNPLILIELTTGISAMLKVTQDPTMQLFLATIMVKLSPANTAAALEKARFLPGLLVIRFRRAITRQRKLGRQVQLPRHAL